MPVYLCQPGAMAAEPWRHGIQVYAAPFALDVASSSSSDNNLNAEQWDATNNEGIRQRHGTTTVTQENTTLAGGNRSSQTTTGPGEPHATSTGQPIRRVRHAEVVLVDDVCMAFDRYWLRLRWPGGRGGFAGYIALGKVSEEPTWLMNDTVRSRTPLGKYSRCSSLKSSSF
jgi:hypothetical protein